MVKKVRRPVEQGSRVAPPLEVFAPREPSFFDRLGARLEGRKTKTPGRALAEIEKLETSGVEELGVPCFVWPAARGRVTGFAVACEEHGVMPFLAPSKRSAILAGARHVKHEHRSKGSVVVRERAPSLKVPSS